MNKGLFGALYFLDMFYRRLVVSLRTPTQQSSTIVILGNQSVTDLILRFRLQDGHVGLRSSAPTYKSHKYSGKRL